MSDDDDDDGESEVEEGVEKESLETLRKALRSWVSSESENNRCCWWWRLEELVMVWSF